MRAQYQAFATNHPQLPLFLILKALTDHLGSGSRVYSFDLYR